MAMGKIKSHKADAARCRRHPRSRQQGAGVCALCLRDRLSRLSASWASLPSAAVRDEEETTESAASSEASSTGCSSTEGSSGASSASGSGSPGFHRQIRRAARPSLLMRDERVVAVDGDEVVGVLRRRRRERTSLWAKLLRATTGGGGSKADVCSLAHAKSVEADSSTAAKWIVF